MRVIFNEFMSIPNLVRAMQHTQFHAKSVGNDLKPTDFLKRNFYFETEVVLANPKHDSAFVTNISSQTWPHMSIQCVISGILQQVYQLWCIYFIHNYYIMFFLCMQGSPTMLQLVTFPFVHTHGIWWLVQHKSHCICHNHHCKHNNLKPWMQARNALIRNSARIIEIKNILGEWLRTSCRNLC